MEAIEFILYVADQAKSTDFYTELLQLAPSLNVPGMTEFKLADSVKLGLMPENGIAKLLLPKMPHPSKGAGIPRCELYLKVADPAGYLERGVKMGGLLISPLQERDWGDAVGYVADLDGHVLAFAKAIE